MVNVTLTLSLLFTVPLCNELSLKRICDFKKGPKYDLIFFSISISS